MHKCHYNWLLVDSSNQLHIVKAQN